MREIFERFKGKVISINCTDPVKIDNFILFLVEDDYFGVVYPKTDFKAYYNYENVVAIYEKDGNPLHVTVKHLLVNNDGMGMGMAIGALFPF